MGCACKENVEKVRKYSDDGQPALKPMGWFRKSVSVIFRALLGLLLFLIVIIAMPFIVLYIIVAAAFGYTVKINLKKIFRLNDRK